MVQYRVRPESLGEVAQMLRSVVATFDGHISETDAAVRNVVDTAWKGEDATAFHTTWGEFQAGATLLRGVLESLAVRLVSAETAYHGNETALGGAFADTRSQLTPQAAREKSGLTDRVSADEQRADAVWAELEEDGA
ncbi:WXG100 family type VII secretion target [Curtobacterium sp. 9128]|uniref:WXG100 family type VII secretion target n=1 Tax=Curtobacterium sp. 9128 TaxID=1793722 RepID=UPI0016424AF0|nr:WXG100 family type VII secretion target [Curtobacterium sp. 9128]